MSDWMCWPLVMYHSHTSCSGLCGVMVTEVGNEHRDTSSNSGPICISCYINTLGKGINPNIIPPAIGKIIGQTGFFNNWFRRMKTLNSSLLNPT